MKKPSGVVALMLSPCTLLGAVLLGCTAPHPYIHGGDANSVEIGYAGDVASTLPLARQHCARFARVTRLADQGLEFARYDCVAP
jgi:hypothetical protein